MATTTACEAVESHQRPLPGVRNRFCIRLAVGQRLPALLREDPDSRPTRILASEIISTLRTRTFVISELGSAPMGLLGIFWVDDAANEVSGLRRRHWAAAHGRGRP